MSGDVVVSYKTRDYVRCKICDNTELHKHEEIDRVVDPDEAVGPCLHCNKSGIHVHMWNEDRELVM